METAIKIDVFEGESPVPALDPRDNAFFAQRQDQRESNARTYARRMRLAITHAKGMMLTDADGKQYFDCLAAAGTLALGHNHPAVVAALRQTLDRELPFQTLDIATPVKDEFTDALFSTLPPAFAKRARIQFCSPAGTDAIEAASKLVRISSGRPTMLAFSGGYHGMTQGALSMMGNLGPKGALTGGGNSVQFMPYPYAYRCPWDRGGEETAGLSASWVRTLLNDPEGGVAAAGLLTEVVQGEGGVIPAPDSWLRDIRAITAESKVPLIVDEVQTGWGRTGRLYAFEHAGITPDVLVLSKAIGGGLPLAVILYDSALDQWQPGAHAGTFRGNTLAMAAGLATLKVIREQHLVEHAERMGARLMAHMRALQKELPMLGDVRGRGLMVGVEIVDPAGKPDALGHPPVHGALASRVRAECLARGLIIEMGGRQGAVARFLAPLIITPEQVDAVADLFGAACRAAWASQ